MRARYLLVVLVAILATAGVVQAAPNALSVAKKALKGSAKANRAAKAADRKARAAQRDAGIANDRIGAVSTLANSANSKADQALGRPVITVAGITEAKVRAAILPGDIETVAAPCPAGQRVISGGATTITGTGGTWTDHASADRSAWIAGGEDLGTTGGEVTAFAYCAPAGQAVASGRRTYRQEAEREENARRAASKRSSTKP